MISIIIQTLKQKKYSLLGFSGISLVFLLMYVAIFPTFSDQQAQFNQLIEVYPKELLKAFNIERELLFNINLESFLAMEMFSLLWPIITIVLLIGFSSSSLAGEIEKKTMDFLLSQPISRLKLFISKYISTLIVFIVYIIFSFLLVIPMAEIFSIDYRIYHYFTTTILLASFGLCIMGISFLASAVFSEKGKANMVVGGLFAIMYVVNLLASLVEKFSDFKYTSLFYYFDATKTIIENKLDSTSLLVFLGIALTTTFLAALIFSKRDISA